MTRRVVLDAEAVQVLLDPAHPSRRQVRAALEAAARLGHDVCIATVTLAELYRGKPRTAALDALLARETGLTLRDTDRGFARLVGGLLAAAGRSSEDLADAHVAAAAVETGGAVLTADPRDLEALLDPYAHVTVVALRDSRA